MRGFFVISGAAMLCGCSAEHRTTSATADINAAAEAAQGDIDTYAANTLQASLPERPAPTVTETTRARVATTEPSTEPVPTAPSPSETQTVALTNATDPSFRCAGETRISVRAEGDVKPGEDGAANSRAGAGVWTKGDGQDLRGDREASDRPATAGCTAN